MINNANGVVEGQPREEEKDTSLRWGDEFQKKTTDIKMGFNNVGRLWVSKKDNLDKNQALIQWIAKYEFDIFGISEVGINWKKINNNRSLKFALGS